MVQSTSLSDSSVWCLCLSLGESLQIQASESRLNPGTFSIVQCSCASTAACLSRKLSPLLGRGQLCFQNVAQSCWWSWPKWDVMRAPMNIRFIVNLLVKVSLCIVFTDDSVISFLAGVWLCNCAMFPVLDFWTTAEGRGKSELIIWARQNQNTDVFVLPVHPQLVPTVVVDTAVQHTVSYFQHNSIWTAFVKEVQR